MKYIVFLTIFVFTACHQNRQLSRLEITLQKAGENRHELENVLVHYKKNPADSLKYLAARFLIENMPGRYSYRSSQLDTLKQRLYKTFITNEYLTAKEAEEWNETYRFQLEKIYDLDVVTSEFLIHNIDLSFRIWDDNPWKEKFTFQDFCEYLLPYRIGDEPLEEWKHIYYDRYRPILDSLYQGRDIVEAGTAITGYLKQEGFRRISQNKIIHPHLGALFLLDYRRGDCDVACDVTMYTLRALGMPCAMDQYVTSPFHRGNHFWNALLDTTGNSVPFLYINAPIDRENFDNRKKGKVYRNCFSIQPEKIKGIYSEKNLPTLFRHSYLKDVSEEYFKNSLTVSLLEGIKNRYVYLGVFSLSGWIPIDAGENKNGVGTFHNVEEKLIYQPLVLKEGLLQPASYPFIWQDNKVTYFIPDTVNGVSARITRKYPVMEHLKRYLSTSVGVKIFGHNSATFQKPELLYTVVDTAAINPTVTPLCFEPIVSKPFRYIEYVAPEKKKIELAELHFYTAHDKELPVKEIFGKKKLRETHQNITKLAIDHDPLSYYISVNTRESLIFDMGGPEVIDRICLLPRNDDNFIRIGDIYELFYHSGLKGWISLGRQTAASPYLFYDNIPSNALLWLRNHSRGKEEQVFFIRDGQQVFAYDI